MLRIVVYLIAAILSFKFIHTATRGDDNDG